MKTKKGGLLCGALALFFALVCFAEDPPEGVLAKISGQLLSPDQASRVFLDDGGLGIANAKTGERLCVITHQVYLNCAFEVSWSPDSRALALVQQFGRSADLFVARQGPDGKWKSEMIKFANKISAFYRENGITDVHTEKVTAFEWVGPDELAFDYVAEVSGRPQVPENLRGKKIFYRRLVQFGPGEKVECRVAPR